MMDELPDRWAELSKDQKRALLEMADGHLWWEQTWKRAQWLKTVGVVVMGIVLFLTWGRDALAHWLQAGGGK